MDIDLRLVKKTHQAGWRAGIAEIVATLRRKHDAAKEDAELSGREVPRFDLGKVADEIERLAREEWEVAGGAAERARDGGVERLQVEAYEEGIAFERARIEQALRDRQTEIDARCVATNDRSDGEVGKAADDLGRGIL